MHIKNILKKLFILYILFTSLQQITLAKIDIVYPKSNGAKIFANSTFFVGSADYTKDLFINGEKTEIYPCGAFLKVVNLSEGENNFIFEEKDKYSGLITDKLTYKLIKPIKKNITNNITQKNNQSLCKSETQKNISKKKMISKISTDNVPLRNSASNNHERITHLYKGVNLFLDYKKNGFYHVVLDDNNHYWINEKHIEKPLETETFFISKISEIKVSETKKLYKFKYKINKQMPYIIKEDENSLELTIFHVNANEFKEVNKKYFSIKPISNNVLTTKIELDYNLFGYDCYYEDGYLYLKIKKLPKINKRKPLKNISIVIDAGHGGKESGAIGFTRIRECEINLDVALKLKNLLEKSGAKVYLTRNDDSYVDLYERVEISRKYNPHFLISLHANALPDGANPFIKHGTSVFYYNNQSKEFAKTIQKEMLQKMKTRDDGVFKNSLVLTRVPSSIAILIEMAYMINPLDYELLLDNYFRDIIAKSIQTGIENYLLNIKNNNN